MSASKKLKYTDENHPLAKKLPRHLEPLPAAAPQSARGTPRRDSPNTIPKRGGGGADSGRARARLYDPGRYGGRNRGKEQEIDKTEVEQEEKLQQWTGMPKSHQSLPMPRCLVLKWMQTGWTRWTGAICPVWLKIMQADLSGWKRWRRCWPNSVTCWKR